MLNSLIDQVQSTKVFSTWLIVGWMLLATEIIAAPLQSTDTLLQSTDALLQSTDVANLPEPAKSPAL